MERTAVTGICCPDLLDQTAMKLHVTFVTGPDADQTKAYAFGLMYFDASFYPEGFSLITCRDGTRGIIFNRHHRRGPPRRCVKRWRNGH